MRLVNIDHEQLVAAAGGDPWRIHATLAHGRPAQIDRVAQAFHAAGRAAKDADSAFALARQWIGEALIHDNGELSIGDSPLLRSTARALGVQVAQLPVIAIDLENIAVALAEAQESSASRIAQLEQQLELADQELTNLFAAEKLCHRDDEQRCRIRAAIRLLDHRAINATATAWQQVSNVRDHYVGALQNAENNLRGHDDNPVVVRGIDQPRPPLPEPVPPPGAGPATVNNWWSSLSPDEKTQLIAQHSPEMGNLNGIPVDVRDEINRAVMLDDLNRVSDLASKHGASVDAVLADSARYGLSAIEVARYLNARSAAEGLAASADALDELNQHPAVFLVRYQPDVFGGDGAAAIAIGNPDTAANTAVLVKGLGSGLKQGTLANPDGVRLYSEANRADWGRDTAVVMWLGYDAPNTPSDSGLYQPAMARTGGRALAADVNAFAVTHNGAPTHMTVVGHSYGSTTVADAAAGFGMHVDDVVLVGSPGTDLAHSAADFRLSPTGHLYVGAASRDQVSWFGDDTIKTPFGGVGLGQDPAVDRYGSVRFKAEVPGDSFNPFYEHSHYFDLGSEALFSIGDVVAGHGDALQDDGMTARHRGEYGLPAFVDPEARREATTGHRHRAPTGDRAR
ncbi:MAG: hypothetical protein JOZ87_20635 [Chloroflexi bacterium]|nr:hypothetical protein [Chloroflexota bacterium]